MRRLWYWLPVPFLCLVASGVVRAAHESAEEHAKHPERTIVLDSQDVRPATTTMDKQVSTAWFMPTLMAAAGTVVLPSTSPALRGFWPDWSRLGIGRRGNSIPIKMLSRPCVW